MGAVQLSFRGFTLYGSCTAKYLRLHLAWELEQGGERLLLRRLERETKKAPAALKSLSKPCIELDRISGA